MTALFNSVCITLIVPVIVFIDSTVDVISEERKPDECVDTAGWHDKINNWTCSAYVSRGWCVNKTLTSAVQGNSIPSLNFPDLNCCECGKQASLKLSSTAQWAQNATTVAGAPDGIPGSNLNKLYHPGGINIVDDDTLYISDTDNDRVVLVRLNSTTATAIIGQDSQSDMFTFNGPTNVFVTRTSIYVMDTWNFRVQKWSRNLSNPVTVAGVLGVNGTSTNMTTLSRSYGLFVDNYANLFVSDYLNNRVMMYPWNSTSGTAGVMVAGTGISGSNPDQLDQPFGLYVDDNGILYIADYMNHRIQKWVIGASSGVTVAGTGVAGSGLSQLYWPNTIVVDLNGYMYISDEGNNRVLRWAPGADVGECIAACFGNEGIAANQLNAPDSIAFDSNGSLYVSDWRNNRVQKFQIRDSITLSTTTGQSTTTQSTISTTSSSTTPLSTTTTTQPTLSPTITSATQTMTTTTTQSTLFTIGTSVTSMTTPIMSSTTTSYSKATLIKPPFLIISIILHVQIFL